MSALQSRLDTKSESFQKNFGYHQKLAIELKEKIRQVSQGGGAEARRKHEERGKLFVRDRITKLIDPGTPFLEIGRAHV